MNYHDIPDPDQTAEGRSKPNTENSPLSFGNQARKYKPRGAKLEPDVSTLARFAGRLIDRLTGKAYSADELIPQNANIVSAIEEDPQASRNALNIPTPILHNEAGLAKFFDAIMRTDEATAAAPAVVSITGFADSMPAYFGNMLAIDLSEKIGLAGLCNPEFGHSWQGASLAVSLTGGAAVASTDYTDLPGANTVTVPVGGKYAIVTPDIGSNPLLAAWVGGGDTDEWAMSPNRNAINLPHGFTKVSIFYEVAPGAGNITGTIKQGQLSDVTSTASAAGTLGLGVMELTPGDAFGAMTVEVTSSTATVRMLGMVFWTGQSGVLYWSSAKGSTKMDDQLPGLVAGEWNPVYSALFSTLNTQLVIHAQRASDAGAEANNHQANYATFFDAYDTLGASQLVLAEPSREPVAENALTTDAINAFLLSEAAARGYTYFDRKALVPAVSPFKDASTDGIHRDPREHRFAVGFLTARLGSFAAAYSRQNGAVSRGQLADERFRLFAAHRCRTRDLIGMGGVTHIATTWSGSGYGNGTVTSDTGFNMVSGAGVAGHSAVTYGQMVAGAAKFETNRHDIVVTANGYRNLNLPSGGGHRAALIFGQTVTAITDITTITDRAQAADKPCFGVEFGHGTDIGGGLLAAEYMRIFAHNGTAMTYSRWVLCNTTDGTPSANGVGIVLHWDRLRQRFNLWGNGNIHGVWPRVSLSVPALASNSCAGAHVQGYIRASGTGHAAGKMQWQHISCSFGNLVMPYAI
jgi:hypothetical protein